MLDPRKKLLELQIPHAPPPQKRWRKIEKAEYLYKKTERKNNVLAYFSSNIWPTSSIPDMKERHEKLQETRKSKKKKKKNLEQIN